MRAFLLAIVLATATTVDAQVVTEMTPERVSEAIAFGSSAKEVKFYTWTGGPAECLASTPYLRVAKAAFDAKRQYGTFTATNVTPEMVAPVVELVCPSKPVVAAGNPRFGFASVQRVVITGKGGVEPIQPTKTESMPETFKNALGAEYEATGQLVTFPLEALQTGREIHVIFDKKVSAKFSKCDDCRIEIKLGKDVR